MMAKYKSYYELLKDPRWQRKRLEVMQRDGFRCLDCDDDAKTLNVHHIRYRRGKKPWEYDDGDLETLCEDCHERQTDLKDRLEALLDPGNIEEVIGFASGLRLLCRCVDAVSVESYEEAVGFVAAYGTDESADQLVAVDRLIATIHSGGNMFTRELYERLMRAQSTDLEVRH